MIIDAVFICIIIYIELLDGLVCVSVYVCVLVCHWHRFVRGFFCLGGDGLFNEWSTPLMNKEIPAFLRPCTVGPGFFNTCMCVWCQCVSVRRYACVLWMKECVCVCVCAFEYREDTSIRQEPEFSTSKHYRKSPWKFIWMICNYTARCWPSTFIFRQLIIKWIWMNFHQSFKKCSILTPDFRKQPQISLKSN